MGIPLPQLHKAACTRSHHRPPLSCLMQSHIHVPQCPNQSLFYSITPILRLQSILIPIILSAGGSDENQKADVLKIRCFQNICFLINKGHNNRQAYARRKGICCQCIGVIAYGQPPPDGSTEPLISPPGRKTTSIERCLHFLRQHLQYFTFNTSG